MRLRTGPSERSEAAVASISAAAEVLRFCNSGYRRSTTRRRRGGKGFGDNEAAGGNLGRERGRERERGRGGMKGFWPFGRWFAKY